MTGILPIRKYGTHSALNMFTEYSMTDPGNPAEYFGFTEEDIIILPNGKPIPPGNRIIRSSYRLKISVLGIPLLFRGIPDNELGAQKDLTLRHRRV